MKNGQLRSFQMDIVVSAGAMVGQLPEMVQLCHTIGMQVSSYLLLLLYLARRLTAMPAPSWQSLPGAHHEGFPRSRFLTLLGPQIFPCMREFHPVCSGANCEYNTTLYPFPIPLCSPDSPVLLINHLSYHWVGY